MADSFKTWHRCIAEDLREFRATEWSTEHSPLMFRVEAALWSTAAKKAGDWYRGVLKAGERSMVRWHEDEAQLSRQRRASAVSGAQGNGARGGSRRSGRKSDQGNATCRKNGLMLRTHTFSPGIMVTSCCQVVNSSFP